MEFNKKIVSNYYFSRVIKFKQRLENINLINLKLISIYSKCNNTKPKCLIRKKN